MLTIDGSAGEGGGQILRTSLALSLVTGRPFRITKIRANRRRPGLLAQHLTAVQAAATIGAARVEGDTKGSGELVFRPGSVTPGDYSFAVGTAGSCTLVCQAVLPALLCADGPSVLKLEGGTHNPFAPPFDFLERAFLPIIGRMGPTLGATLERPGFYPAGGGRMQLTVEPAAGGELQRVDLLERGRVLKTIARAVVADLPAGIGERELERLATRLDYPPDEQRVERALTSCGPGNVLLLDLACEQITEVFVGFGKRGLPAEKVADRVASEAQRYLSVGAPVGQHLADQLLIPMALAGGGTFRTLSPTRHLLTNIEVIHRFIDLEITREQVEGETWQIEVKV